MQTFECINIRYSIECICY